MKNDSTPTDKKARNKKKKENQPELSLPSLRESCPTKASLFDQVDANKRLDSARELESRTARLNRMKQELYQSMTSRTLKREPVVEVTSELHPDISKVLDMDEQIMNFNHYLPGKMLGSNLMIGNLTDFDQIIELSVDSNSYKYNIRDIISRYPNVK